MSYKTKPCPVCHRTKRMSGETCSTKCRTRLVRRRYGQDFYARAGKAASRGAQSKFDQERRENWERAYPGVPYDVLIKVRRDGYSAGYNASNMAQRRYFERMRAKEFEAGYQQALLDARKSA